MTYKVFLVEDEIVTREGIRDTVDWAAAGYQFCGEAPDGEIALVHSFHQGGCEAPFGLEFHCQSHKSSLSFTGRLPGKHPTAFTK